MNNILISIFTIHRQEWVGGKMLFRFIFLIVNIFLCIFLINDIFYTFNNPDKLIIVEQGWRYSTLTGIQLACIFDAFVALGAIYSTIFLRMKKLLFYTLFWFLYVSYIVFYYATINW